MAQIFIVTTPSNSGLGDSLQTAFNKCNSNFADLYTGAPTGLPAATGSLTGLEIVVVNSAGQPETVTTAQIAALAGGNVATTFGDPGASEANFGAANSLSNQIAWAQMTVNATSGAFPSGIGSEGSGPNWSQSAGSATAHFSTPTATTIWGAAGAMTVQQTSGTTNSAIDVTGGQMGAGGFYQSYRALASGLPIAGFTMTYYGAFSTLQSAQTAFIGYAAAASPISGSQVIGNLLNTIGFGKDTGDSLLYLYYNGASGSATKVSTGITFANLAAHMFKVSITCDGLGNINASFVDLEPASNAGSYSVSLPTATANLPATNTAIQPRIYISTGAQTGTVAMGIKAIFNTFGFAA
jgi:hypothetical protein